MNIKNINRSFELTFTQSKINTQKKALIAAGGVVAGATLLTLADKGFFGLKLKNIASSILNFFKSFFVCQDKTDETEAQNIHLVKQKTDETNHEQQDYTSEEICKNKQIQTYTLPQHEIKDLFSQATALKQDIFSDVYGENGLINKFNIVEADSKNGLNVDKEATEILSLSKRLEENIVEYNSLMYENNSAAAKFGFGKLIPELQNMQLYLQLIQRANQLLDIVKYDNEGLHVDNDALIQIVSSWNML